MTTDGGSASASAESAARACIARTALPGRSQDGVADERVCRAGAVRPAA